MFILSMSLISKAFAPDSIFGTANRQFAGKDRVTNATLTNNPLNSATLLSEARQG
jgi:hypothetical protein